MLSFYDHDTQLHLKTIAISLLSGRIVGLNDRKIRGMAQALLQDKSFALLAIFFL